MALPRAALLLSLLVACSVGEVPLPGGAPDGGATADAPASGASPGAISFNMKVKPLVTACVACHSGGQAPNLTSFDALDARYKMKPGNTNILVTKGAHQGQPFLTADGITTVTAWINSL